jgi:hypothetical protein
MRPPLQRAMKTFLLKFAVLAGTIALTACRKDPLGSTGAQIDIRTEDSRLFASYFVLSWMDDQNQLFQIRVPEDEGTFIDEEQAPTVSVFIALAADQAGKRRVLVRGFRDGIIISEGAAGLITAPNVWVQLGLKMFAGGSLADQDGDGLPDTIDNCPRERDPCGQPDAGVESPPDADPDLAPDLPDAGPDLPGDLMPVMPTNIPDAAPDLGRRDLRPS